MGWRDLLTPQVQPHDAGKVHCDEFAEINDLDRWDIPKEEQMDINLNLALPHEHYPSWRLVVDDADEDRT